MAIINHGLLKTCRGKLGDIIFYQLKGKTCLRTRVDREKIKFNSGQLAQQERMASASIFYRAVKAVGMHYCWQTAARNMQWTGYNLFLHCNLPVFTGEGNIGDFDKLQLSTGKLPLPDKMNIGREGESEWKIGWDNTAHSPGASENDRFLAVVMKREDVFTIKLPVVGDYRRKHCRAIIRLPPELREFIHLFCYFCSDTGDAFSVSRHFLLNS